MNAILEHISQLSHWQIDLWAMGLLLQGAIAALVPEEVVMTTMGLLWSQGHVGFFEAVVSIQIGLLPANTVMLTLGRRIGWPILRRFPFRILIKPEWIEVVLKPVRKHAARFCFCTRFIPTIRGPVYFSLGLSGFPLRKFMMIDAFASCFQIPALLFLGRTIGKNSASIMQAYQKVGLVFLIVLGSGIAIGVAMNRLKTKSRPPAL